jgi:conjugative relaxase-like TrwC/TraI family protein
MLSIAKLRVGQEAYTLAGVAQSLDDYYTGRGEADGAWVGVGAERLGLDGPVGADDLRAVLAGIAPGTGGLTPNGETLRTHPRRVPGFDLTFKAPKSVSVLYAVTDDPRVQGQIIEAGEAAVGSVVSWLEREAIRVRRGSGDAAYLNDLAARDPEAAEAAKVRVIPGRGVVAAVFRHRTSRAGDPLLHWHTLVANLVEGPDGRWGAFVHPELYRSVRAAGELFQAALRNELTERLGLQWCPGRHVPEVAGVPQHLCDVFSKRAAEIDAWLDATGTPDDPAGRQAAVLATRRGKPEVEGERYDAAWKIEAADAGWGPAQAEALLSRTAGLAVSYDEVWRLASVDPESAAMVDRAVTAEDWIADVGRALTEHDTTFTRPQLVEAVAARIGEGASVATVDRIVSRVLASPQIVPIDDRRTNRWTTTTMLDVEQRFLTTAESTRNSRAPIDETMLGGVLGHGPQLGPEQESAVRAITLSPDAMTVLVGPAGTGKTFTLDAVRRVFEAAGYDVVGVAPSARAAQELATDAHIPSATIHRQLGAWDRGLGLPAERTVLVVDEAAMAGIRELERVTRPVIAAGGRVVLVGDHHQLPEITAGGGFAALAVDPNVTVAELTVNRRQHHEWERDALAELRDGHVATAVAAYRNHYRIVIADDRADMINAAVDRWFDAYRSGAVPVLLAGTNDVVAALNHAVRGRLVGAGVITPRTDHLALGERLVMRINDYQARTIDDDEIAVLNGQTGTLVALDDDGIVVRIDHDESLVRVGSDYIAAGGIDYAYATTAHRAQGGTWDLAIAVGLDGLYREAGYLVMSRGRHANWLILTQPEVDNLDHDVGRHDSALPLLVEEPDAIDDVLHERLSASRRKALATARDPHASDVHRKAVTLDLPTLERWAEFARAVEAQATHRIGDDPGRAQARLVRLCHTAHHVAVGQRVKAWDRRNIGTVTALGDNGTVHVDFVSANGNTAHRTFDWVDITIVDPPQPRPRVLSEHDAARLDHVALALTDRIDQWQRHLACAGVQPNDAHVYTAAASLAVNRAAAAIRAAQPAWLTALLGTRPTDNPAATQVWEDAVQDLASHRLRAGVADPLQPTGPDCTGAANGALWTAVSATVADARGWLDDDADRLGPEPMHTRTIGELHDRKGELDAILSTAPADVRGLVEKLQNMEALPFDEIDSLLGDVTAAHRERRQWILQHWPHVVEAAQVASALDAASTQGESPMLLDDLMI